MTSETHPSGRQNAHMMVEIHWFHALSIQVPKHSCQYKLCMDMQPIYGKTLKIVRSVPNS